MNVVGYVDGGEIYCVECAEGRATRCDAVFDHNEFDYPVHCDYCRAFIPTALTREGERDVHRRVAKGGFDEDLYAEYDAYFGFGPIRYCVWTFIGPCDALGNFENF